MTARARALLVLVAALAGLAAAPVDEQVVHEIAAELRCVVCQSLSVADSPSETAHQMRGIIRERLAAGQTPDQIKAYFVDKYGTWILLSPPPKGFSLLVWITPFAGLAVGLLVIALTVRRWTRRSTEVTEAAPPLDAAMQERIRRDLAERRRD